MDGLKQSPVASDDEAEPEFTEDIKLPALPPVTEEDLDGFPVVDNGFV